ncbi:MAG: 50S ribosomal protein L21 [Planctomycetaceae bacterium]|nr:50S ribosomal protein L21 [Planctomycetaceae bacterium]
MFAIIEDSGRQFKVSPGTELAVDLRDDLEAGSDVVFDRILLANGGGASLIGAPVINGASISATVVDPFFKGPKLEVQKFTRRKNTRSHTGHRQKYLIVKIGEFNIPGLEIVEKPAETAAAEE